MIQRRRFLAGTTALSSSLMLPMTHWQRAYGIAAADPFLSTMGLQLYTLRNQMKEDPKLTIETVAKAGYKQVELMDVMESDKLVPLAKSNGLTVTSAFIQWNILGEARPAAVHGSIEKCIEKAAQFGLKYLVFGYIGKGSRETVDQLKGIAERSNRAGDLCKSAGLQLCYHHHSFEFQPIAGGKTGMDIFIENFDPVLVPFEIDVFWAAIGGWDPIETLKRLKGRVVQVHLKDLKPNTPTTFDESQVPKDAFQEVGVGSINMRDVLKVSREIGVAQCHVEQDQSPDPIASVRKSIGNLQSM